MKSVGSVLDANNGIGPGFGLLRLILALCVVYVHSSLIDKGATAEAWWPFGARWALANLPVPAFFVLSGFLVAGSMARSRVDEFLVNRLLRLLPALVVVVLVTALVLGPLITTLPAERYFTDRAFLTFLLNIFGLHQDTLPGVFTGNPEPLVNGSLWTLPHEMSCYILLSLLAAAGVFSRRALVLALVATLYTAAILLWLADRTGLSFPYREALTYAFVGRGAARLVPLFLTGVLFWQYREAIPYNRWIAAAAAAAMLAIAVFGNETWADMPLVWMLTAPMFAYLAVYLGLAGWFVIPLIAGVDYSYGIYLFGYPVQQTLLYLMPGIRSYPYFFLLAVVPTVVLAALSWHLVEKPALGLRHGIRSAVCGVTDRLALFAKGRVQARRAAELRP